MLLQVLRLRLVVATPILATFFAGCNGEASSGSRRHPVWDQSHDLGLVFVSPEEHRGFILRHDFEIRNPASSVLELEPLSTSCGCTQPIISHEAIGPGESARVELVTEARGRTGQVREYAILQTNLPKRPHLRLHLSATLLLRLESTQSSSGPIRVRERSVLDHVFQVMGREPLDEPQSTLSMVASPDAEGLCEASLGPVEHRIIDGSYRVAAADVHLRLRCPKPVSDSSTVVGKQVLRFVFGEAILEQTIIWEPDLPILATPSRVFLRRRPASAAPRHTLRLQAEQPFSIKSITVSSDEINVSSESRGRSSTHELSVAANSATPGTVFGSKRFEIIVTADDLAEETVKVPVLLLDTR